MASGKTHDWTTLLLSLPAGWLCYRWLHLSAPASLLVCAGIITGGLLLSPDLDTRSRPFYRWGWFRFIWWPYQWVAKHRSGLSHGLFVAPVFRLIYLSAVLILLYFVVAAGIQMYYLGVGYHPLSIRISILSFLNRHLDMLLTFSAGVWLGCLLHVTLDAISDQFPRQ